LQEENQQEKARADAAEILADQLQQRVSELYKEIISLNQTVAHKDNMIAKWKGQSSGGQRRESRSAPAISMAGLLQAGRCLFSDKQGGHSILIQLDITLWRYKPSRCNRSCYRVQRGAPAKYVPCTTPCDHNLR
jgi:hypothetical protein